MRSATFKVNGCLVVSLRGLAGCVAVLSPCFATTSVAQSYEPLYMACYSGAQPDLVIASCSVLIGRRLAIGEDLATAFKNRGNAYDDKGDHVRAMADFGQALAINAQDADAFNSRGTTHTALGQYDRAVLDFDQAVALNPGSPVAYGNRCFARALLGQLEAGLADCNEALRLRSDNPGALAARAFVHLKARRADEAIADYNAELHRRPEDAYSLFGRGLARYLKGDQPGGKRDIAAARATKADIDDYMARPGLRQQDFH
jgi:tetratricopeptide (TPR) repeat protein